MKKLIFITMLLLPFNTNAAFNCDVQINNVLIYKGGWVNVRHTGRNDYTYICSLAQEWKGIDVVTCAMWASMLQNVQKNNGLAQFYYEGEGNCATLPTYSSSPSPVYIGTE